MKIATLAIFSILVRFSNPGDAFRSTQKVTMLEFFVSKVSSLKCWVVLKAEHVKQFLSLHMIVISAGDP
eukprot:10052591-Heterocapsa_arctica.AAC.1